MRTILDTSTGYGTACVIHAKGGGDKYVISSAVSSLKELGYTRFRCRTDPEPAIKAMVDAVIKCLSDDRAVEQIFSRRDNSRESCGATAFENLKGVSYKKPLMQFGERCHWLDAEHLIGTPGGVIQVRTVRRLTREQGGDDVSKRAFDNFNGSPQNLSSSKPSQEDQTAHGEKRPLTPGCKVCIWARWSTIIRRRVKPGNERSC